MLTILREAKPFPVTEACVTVYEDEDVRAYWVETSGFLFFIDVETGFKINSGARKFADATAAKAFAEAEMNA